MSDPDERLVLLRNEFEDEKVAHQKTLQALKDQHALQYRYLSEHIRRLDHLVLQIQDRVPALSSVSQLESARPLENDINLQLPASEALQLSHASSVTMVSVPVNGQTIKIRVDAWKPSGGSRQWGLLLESIGSLLSKEGWQKVLGAFCQGKPLTVISTRLQEPSFGSARRLKASVENGMYGARGPCFNPNEDNINYSNNDQHARDDRWLLVWQHMARQAKASEGHVIQIIDLGQGLSQMQVAEAAFASDIGLRIVRESCDRLIDDSVIADPPTPYDLGQEEVQASAPEEPDACARSLQQLTDIATGKVSVHNLPMSGLQQLMIKVGATEKILWTQKVLDVRGKNLDATDVPTVLRVIASNTRLQELDLRNNMEELYKVLEDKRSREAVAQVLRTHPALCKLHVDELSLELGWMRKEQGTIKLNFQYEWEFYLIAMLLDGNEVVRQLKVRPTTWPLPKSESEKYGSVEDEKERGTDRQRDARRINFQNAAKQLAEWAQ